MIRLWPKTYLKWKEPLIASRARQAGIKPNWKLNIFGFPAIVGMLLLVWLLAHLNPEKNPPSFGVALLLAAMLAVLLLNIVPLLYWYVRPEILIRSWGLLYRHVDIAVQMHWRSIASCHISIRTFGEVELSMLHVLMKNGTHHEFEIDPAIPLDQLRHILLAQGVTIDDNMDRA